MSASRQAPVAELLTNFEVEQIVTAHLRELTEMVQESRFLDLGLLGPVEAAEKTQLYLRSMPAVANESEESLSRIRDMLRKECSHKFTPLEELHILNFLPSTEPGLHILLSPQSPFATDEARPVLLQKIAQLRLFDPSSAEADPSADVEADAGEPVKDDAEV